MKSREFIAVGMWTAAICIMSFGVSDSDRLGHTSVWLALGLFVGVGALVPTGWFLLDHALERVVRRVVTQELDQALRTDVSIERVVRVVDALHAADHQVTPFPRR